MRSWKIRTICIATLLTVLVCTVVAYAEQQPPLKSLFIDLKGWEATEAEVVSVGVGEMKTVTAVREYTKGDMNTKDDMKMEVVLVIGGDKLKKLQKIQDLATGLSVAVDTSDASTSVSTIDGFQVSAGHDKTDNSGSIVVALAQSETQSAVLTFAYEGLSAQDALNLANQFDWKAIQAAGVQVLKSTSEVLIETDKIQESAKSPSKPAEEEAVIKVPAGLTLMEPMTYGLNDDITLSKCFIKTDDDGIIVKDNADVVISECQIIAGKYGIKILGNGNVILQNSIIQGGQAAAFIDGNGELEATGSKLKGGVKTQGNADFIDGGGNTIE